jgi:4-aminobutyrate aminotransferase-like enzyme
VTSFLARPRAGGAIEIAGAEGCHVIGKDGRRYVDFTSGGCVGNLGWSERSIRDAIRRHDGPAYVYPGHLYRPWEALAERLCRIAPGRLVKCFRATGGSEAVEIALQAAMLHTGRRRFVSIRGARHGDTIGARSVGGEEIRARFPLLLPQPRTIRPPLDRRRLARVESALARGDVAGFIMEPIICNLGVVVPDRLFMQGVQDICRRHGALLILDEVATGFGRTGRLFAAEHYDLEPDLLCIAKAVTGGYAPMGATLATGEVARSMLKVGVCSTYGWHPLSVAAALANLDHWEEYGERLLGNVISMGRLLVERIGRMKFRAGFEVHAAGLAIGIELNDEACARTVRRRCREEGLLIAQEGSRLALFPPLVMDEAVAGEGLAILELCAAP